MTSVTYYVRYVDLIKGEFIEEEMSKNTYEIVAASECFQVLSREYKKVSIKL